MAEITPGLTGGWKPCK